MSSISKNISLTFGFKIIGTLLALGSSIFLARLLGKEGNGVYGLLIANVNLFVVILGFGMSQTMTYFVAKKNTSSSHVNAIGLYFTLIASFIFSTFVFVLYYFEIGIIKYLVPNKYLSAFILLFLIVNFLHKSTINYFIGVWQGTLKFLDMNVALLLGNSLRLIVLGILWLYIKYLKIDLSVVQVLYFVVGILVVDVLIRSAIFIKGKNPINLKIKIKDRLTKSIIIFGSVGIATRVLNFANKRIDIWFVEAYEGLEELGIYVLAAGLIEIIIATIVPGIQVLIPYFTQRSSQQRLLLLSKVSRINVLFTTILIFLASVMSILIIPFLYGEVFRDSITPFILLSFGAYFLLIRNVFTSFNIAINNQKVNLQANILSLIITLVLDLVLIPKYGVLGACYASIAAYFSSCSFVVLNTVVKSKISVYRFLFISLADIKFLYNFANKNILTRFK